MADPTLVHKDYLKIIFGERYRHVDDILTALGHRENAGSPVSASLVPQFVGQICFDTTGLDYYIAFSTTAGDWAPLAVNTVTLAEMLGIDGLTATAAELNGSSKVSTRLIPITDASTYLALAQNSGKTHVFPDLSQTCTVTLPTASAGLTFKFIGKAVAADASNWVFTAITPSFLFGGVAFLDNDAGAGADEVHAGVYPNGSSHLTATIVTPAAGTYIELTSDGTNWIINGVVISATIPTFG